MENGEQKKRMWKAIKAFQLYYIQLYIFDCRNGTCVRMYIAHFRWNFNEVATYRVSGIRIEMELSLKLSIQVPVSQRLLRIFIVLFIHLICGVGGEIQFVRFEYRKQLLFNTFHWIVACAPFYNWEFKSTNQFQWKKQKKNRSAWKTF